MKGIPLSQRRHEYHRLERQPNGDYIAVRMDGYRLKVKKPKNRLLEVMEYHFKRELEKAKEKH